MRGLALYWAFVIERTGQPRAHRPVTDRPLSARQWRRERRRLEREFRAAIAKWEADGRPLILMEDDDVH